MNKYRVIVTKTVSETWVVDAESEEMAQIVYDLEGELRSEKIISSDTEVEEY